MKRIGEILKSPAFILITALAVGHLLYAYFFIPKAFKIGQDSVEYHEAMRFLLGQQAGSEVVFRRLLTTPFMLMLSVIFSFLVGSLYGGMLAVNIILYPIFIYVFYRLGKIIFHEKSIAVYATVLLVSNYCMFNYGVNYITDMGGWFFFVLSSLFAIQYYKDASNRKWFYYSALAASIGVMFKETGALGMLTLGMVILLIRSTWSVKIRSIALAAAVFLALPALYHIWFYAAYDFWYMDWYGYNIDAYIAGSKDAESAYSAVLTVKVLGWLYLVGWPMVAYGAWQLWKHASKQQLLILLALLPGSLAFIAWPALTQRIAFVLVPLLSLIAGYGLSRIPSPYFRAAYFTLYIVVAYTMRLLMNAINLPL